MYNLKFIILKFQWTYNNIDNNNNVKKGKNIIIIINN